MMTLKEARLAAGLSQSQAAEVLGTDKTRISRIERTSLTGGHLHTQTLYRLVRAYGMDDFADQLRALLPGLAAEDVAA